MLDNFNLNKLRESDTKVSYMDGFSPMMINETYLRELGVGVQPSQETLSELRRGSSAFLNRYEDKSMVTDSSFSLKDISFDEPLKTHRYTNKCPIDVLEVDPMVGCNLNCLYCLVRAGDHSAPKTVYENYGSYLRTKLEENGLNHYYYFSAKTEPFQEATLKTGIAHQILKEFIVYFKKNPKSKSKLFIISKAGKEELLYKNNGDTILDLMEELSGNLTYDISISVMPPKLYPILEPRAASNQDRLEAAMLCQGRNISARWALVQPIIPGYFSGEIMIDLLIKLKKANIERFKPEFLTVSTENLASIGQLIGHLDKNLEKNLYDVYLAPDNMNNIKHKSRLAPDRIFSRHTMLKLKEHADEHGIEITLCNWLRNDLNITESEIPSISRTNWNREIGVCKPV